MKYGCLCVFTLIYLTIKCQDRINDGDIGPIIYKNCTPCHRHDQATPFFFENFKEIENRRKQIQNVVEKGIMPPWKADTTYSRFSNERVLSRDEVRKLQSWCENSKSLKLKVRYDENRMQNDEFEKKKVISFTSGVNDIPANNRDTTIYIKIEYSIPQDVNTREIKILPGLPRFTHHVNVTFLRKNIPGTASGPFFVFDVTENGKVHTDTFYRNNIVYADGWVPGTQERKLPVGIGCIIPSEGILVFESHYQPLPKNFKDEVKIKIALSTDSIKRLVSHFTIGSFGNDGEPNPPLVLQPDSMAEFVCRATFDEDLSIIAMNPHMHYLGKAFTAFMVKPNGDTTQLIRINDWNFNWQEFYRPLSLIKIPKGSAIYVVAKFDNTDRNINNPYHPPKFIRQGHYSKDEMINLNLDLILYRPGDEQIINE